MAYYLHRLTPLHDWQVMNDPPLAHPDAVIFPVEGEIIKLPGVECYSQAQAEADRLNGKGNREQGVLPI